MLPRGAHILVFRTDGVGDLVLTLPVAAAVKRHDPDARVTFVTQEYAAPLARLCPDIDAVLPIPGRDLAGTPLRFASTLRAQRADAAVFCYPRPRLALAARLAGIPHRAGTAFRYYAVLFNRRLRVHRRGGDLHERDLNLALLGTLGLPPAPAPDPRIVIDAATGAAALRVLEQAGAAGARVAVVHPGSGGSARDWPPDCFAALAARLADHAQDLVILVSGGRGERPLVERVLREAARDRVRALPPLPLEQFAGVLHRAALVVSNSTGPLHLGAAVGAPALGLYPFDRGLSPRRWGPVGPRAHALTPPRVSACAACAAEHCAEHDRMDLLPVDTVLDAARTLLAGRV